jgi:HSP20 family protein
MTFVKLKSDKFPAPRVFSDYFEDFFGKDFPSSSGHNFGYKHFPPVNVVESKEQYVLELSAPGRTKADFNIKLDGNLLEVSSTQKEENNEDGKDYTRREFKLSSFSRSFTLPETVNGEAINAEYTDGILKLTLPKKEEAKSKGPKEIAVS